MRPLERIVVIRNALGLHARASARLCAVAGAFDATISVKFDDLVVPATSIMGLMMLGAGEGARLILIAEGPQAEDALDTLVKLVEDGFGETEDRSLKPEPRNQNN